MTPVAQFITKKREALRLTQLQLAQKMGVDASYINRVENGKKSPGNFVFLERLAMVLELSPIETKTFFELAKSSKQVIRMPIDSSARGYILVSNLVAGLSHLTDTQYKLLETVLEHFKCDFQQVND